MAISTKNIILSPQDLDSAWAFRHLLNLPANALHGEDMKIRSVFALDSNPSFSIYKSGDIYKYRCFSQGIGGDYIDLTVALQKIKGNHITRKQAMNILKQEFEAFVATGKYQPQDNQVVMNGKARVTDYELRTWNEDDKLFWEGRYGITQKILEFYNVAAVKHFTMEKLKNGKMEKYDFDHPRIYGYFRKDGSLDRLYRPGSKKGKFIKVGGPYVQGSDQIVKPKKNLIYIKSLKDVMGFHTLEIDDYDVKAPDAEGILVPKIQIEEDKKTYYKILTWMDPDKSGVTATNKYREQYGLPPIEFDMGPKDLTDALEIFNPTLVRITLMQLL